MGRHPNVAEELIAEAEKFDGIQAGIASVNKVLEGPSYKAEAGVKWQDDHAEKTIKWLPNARSLLVLAMHHPKDEPELDWFDRGNTAGNRRMTEISKSLVSWLLRTHDIRAQALPYQKERGGVYLKDAAVFAGLGVVGKNNLLLHPVWGPSVRLRSVLIQDDLPPSAPLDNFNPCFNCDMPCRKACPLNAFDGGQYHRPACMQQLESDRKNSIKSGQIDSDGSTNFMTQWCRRCEFACPVGSK